MIRLWHLARWLVRLEIGIWRSLALWAARRVPGRTPQHVAFSYAKEVTPLLWVFIFVSSLEVPVVHLLVPWEPVKLALLVVGIWGVVWMLGYLASFRVFQHLLGADGLRIRSGTDVDILLPWFAIAGVRAARGGAERDRVHADQGVLRVPVLKRTQVVVTLRAPTSVRLRDRTEDEITEVRFSADAPRALVSAADAHLSAVSAATPP